MSFKLRLATASDLPRLEECALEFYKSSEFLNTFDIVRFSELWAGLLETGAGVIFILEDPDSGAIAGTIGGVHYKEPYSTELIATEFFWFVRDGKRGGGIRLYKAFEDWARDRGCSQIRMVHLIDSMPKKLEQVYQRFGYRAAEVHYTKGL
jgi:GNAT superfamily N-acetyltransferase